MSKSANYSFSYNLNKINKIIGNIREKGFSHHLSANVIIVFLAFGSQLLVAKFLTPSELGQIKAIQSFIGVCPILAGFGFNTAVLKLCSEKRFREKNSYALKWTTSPRAYYNE